MSDTAQAIFSARARLAIKIGDLLDRTLRFEADEEPGEEDATVILKLSQAFVTLTAPGTAPSARKHL